MTTLKSISCRRPPPGAPAAFEPTDPAPGHGYPVRAPGSRNEEPAVAAEPEPAAPLAVRRQRDARVTHLLLEPGGHAGVGARLVPELAHGRAVAVVHNRAGHVRERDSRAPEPERE